MNARTTLLLTVTGGVAAAFAERFARRRLDGAARERQALRDATQELQHRNQQLTALYTVFSEITETLSLRYVVHSTMRETNKLMGSDLTMLRVLRGDELPVIGALSANGTEVKHIASVKLGEGITGRVARQGRPSRLDTNAEVLMRGPVFDPNQDNSPSHQTGTPPMQSGIVMPLIVGARVVGTLSCWSQKPYAFDNEDQRILEMMASQVATAVVAAEAMETSERRAHHDALTDLPNRHQLNADLQGPLAELAASGRKAVVAMIDIDHFKAFNDDYGHRVGDVTLQKVASVMRNSVRERDLVYRYGGEEFVVVFDGVGADEAVNLAERLRQAVQSTPFSGDQLQPVGPVTISIGLAVLGQATRDFKRLIELADKAMYAAKSEGRNRVVLWEERPTPLAASA